MESCRCNAESREGRRLYTPRLPQNLVRGSVLSHLTEAKMQWLLLDWLAFLGFSEFSCCEADITSPGRRGVVETLKIM
jgi:hypothetical protein